MKGSFLIHLLFILAFVPAKSQKVDKLIRKHNLFTQNYYVELTTNKGNNVDTPFEFRQNNTIKYTTSIKWLALKDDKITVEINRTSDMYVNDKSSELTVANNLAVRTSAALYPLILSYDANGNIIEVENFDEIQKRWETVKKELQQDFHGEGLDRYIYKNNQRYRSTDALAHALNNDCFLNMLFNNIIYTEYLKDTAIKDFHFPYIQNTMAIKNTVKLHKYIDDNGTICVHFDGTLTDKRSKSDLKNESNYPYYTNSPLAKGQCFGTYFIDPVYNNIQSLMFLYTITLEIDKSIMLKILHINDLEKPIKDLPKVKNSTDKIYIPISIYSDTEKDVQRHLNPLMDIKDMTRRDHTGEGIIIGGQ